MYISRMHFEAIMKIAKIKRGEKWGDYDLHYELGHTHFFWDAQKGCKMCKLMPRNTIKKTFYTPTSLLEESLKAAGTYSRQKLEGCMTKVTNNILRHYLSKYDKDHVVSEVQNYDDVTGELFGILPLVAEMESLIYSFATHKLRDAGDFIDHAVIYFRESSELAFSSNAKAVSASFKVLNTGGYQYAIWIENGSTDDTKGILNIHRTVTPDGKDMLQILECRMHYICICLDLKSGNTHFPEEHNSTPSPITDVQATYIHDRLCKALKLAKDYVFIHILA